MSKDLPYRYSRGKFAMVTMKYRIEMFKSKTFVKTSFCFKLSTKVSTSKKQIKNLITSASYGLFN